MRILKNLTRICFCSNVFSFLCKVYHLHWLDKSAVMGANASIRTTAHHKNITRTHNVNITQEHSHDFALNFCRELLTSDVQREPKLETVTMQKDESWNAPKRLETTRDLLQVFGGCAGFNNAATHTSANIYFTLQQTINWYFDKLLKCYRSQLG